MKTPTKPAAVRRVPVKSMLVNTLGSFLVVARLTNLVVSDKRSQDPTRLKCRISTNRYQLVSFGAP
jgi:hypothetical protein